MLTHPHERFLRLLRGDQQVRVTRLTGGPVPQPFVIEDPESLEYLTNALRAAEPDGYVPKRRDGSDRTGPTLHVQVWTDRLGSYSTSFELPNDERVSGMTVFCELDDHYYFWVPLPQPIPAPLAKVFAAEREGDRANRPRR
ncbi:MAG: hypothetical protein JWO38_6558 [Gemmataceae bacterium]|nr:hypothetical protein [Gemmataceae bacterium]